MTTLERGANWELSIYGREHGKQHVHVTEPNFRASLVIDNDVVLVDSLPVEVLQQAQPWLHANRADVLASWHAHNPSL